MKPVILVSFVLLLPMFLSGVVQTLHFDNVNHKKMVKKEVVMNEKIIDLEVDYTGPHPRPSVPSGPPKIQVDDDVAITKERPVYIKYDYMDPAPVPVMPRPRPYIPPPPHHKNYKINF